MKSLFKTEKRKFWFALLVSFLLLGALGMHSGVIGVPQLFSSSPAAHAAPPPPPTVSTQSEEDAEEQAALDACNMAAASGAAAPCFTPGMIRAFSRDMTQYVFPWMGRHWIDELLGLGILASLITSLVFFFRMRRAKKEAELIPLPNGEKIGPPPGSNKSKARLILPGTGEFKGRTFDKVIGQKQGKKDIQEYLDFVRHPERFEGRGIKIPRGVLLHGWHGTGKTLLVGTLANEASVPVLIISGSDFIEMFVGVGASRVRELYEYADVLAKHFGWCFIVIDEIDGIGGHRGSGGGGGGGQEHDQTINQLLVELDGLIPRPRVITFGTTNLMKKLDPALLRRFPRQIEFFRPTRNDRESLFEHYLPLEWRAEGLNLKQAARTTPGATGSDIATITNEAKILAARKGADVLVDNEILDEAIQRVRYGLAREKADGLLTEEEQNVVRWHEAGHALIYWLITGKFPERFTDIPRGQSGGHVEYAEDGEFMRDKEGMLTHIAVALGGWAATMLGCKGRHDTGPSNDIEQATDTALSMVKDYGMSNLGFMALEVLKQKGFLSESMKDKVIAEVNAIIEAQRVRVLDLMSNHMAELRCLVEAVQEKETLLADDFKEAIEKAQQAAAAERPVTVEKSATITQWIPRLLRRKTPA